MKKERRKVDIEKRQVNYIQIYIERGNGTLRQRMRKEGINREKRERKKYQNDKRICNNLKKEVRP